MSPTFSVPFPVSRAYSCKSLPSKQEDSDQEKKGEEDIAICAESRGLENWREK